MNRRLIMLSAVALLLGAYVLAQGLLGRTGDDAVSSKSEVVGARPDAPVTGASEHADPVRLNPLETLDAESFSAILDRPLFNPGRAARPPEAPPPPPAEEPAAPEAAPQAAGPLAQDYRLLAVATGPSGRVAALRLETTGEVLYLREGQVIQSWTLLSVEDRSVVIGTEETNVIVSLFEGSPAATQPAAETLHPPAGLQPTEPESGD